MGDERLLTFVYGFLIDADALVLGQQRPLCPWPEVCSCNQDMGLGAGIDAEMNISATGVSVVFGAFQLNLSGKKSILLQTGSVYSS